MLKVSHASLLFYLLVQVYCLSINCTLMESIDNQFGHREGKKRAYRSRSSRKIQAL